MTLGPISIFVTLFTFLLALPSRAADWPQWRGPTGQGYTDDAKLPLTWDIKTGENIVWKAPLPKGDVPYSSPIVFGNRVFLTVAMNNTRAHHVLCFDKNDGKPLWDTTIEPGPWTLTDTRAGYAASTPAADAERVYVLFGSAVLAALDHDGKVLWRRALPTYDFDVGIGCSPILYGDTIVLQSDLKKQSSLIAFDKKTGEIKWEAKRPDSKFAHSTPIIVTLAGKPVMMIAGSDSLEGVDPAGGTVFWSCKIKGDTVSPVYADGMAYVDSGRGGPGFGVAIDGAKAEVKWTVKYVNEAFGSPAIVGPNLYRLSSPGTLKCTAMADGKDLFTQRLEGATAAASPIVTKDGTIYFASSGRSFVIKAGPKYEQLASNNLDDPNYASPAISDGRIYIKGQKFLYCIGSK